MRRWWVGAAAGLVSCGPQAERGDAAKPPPASPAAVEAAAAPAAEAADLRLEPKLAGLEPTRLELLASRVAQCGGPWARDFVDEDEAIRQTGRAVRDGDWLTVGVFRRRDNRGGTDGRFGVREEYPTLDYFGVYERSGVDLVHAQYGEGDGYVLVDQKSGESVELSYFPVPSPSGRWFAAASDDVAYNNHGVEIVERTLTGFGPVKAFNEQVLQTPCGLRWTSDDAIAVRVRKTMVEGDASLDHIDPPPEMADASLTFNGGAWTYHPPR